MGEHDAAGLRVAELACEHRTAGLCGFILCGLEWFYCSFPAFRDNGLPGIYICEEAAAVIEPHIGGGEVQAGDGVQGDVPFVTEYLQVQPGNTVDPCLTVGQ